MEGRTSCTPLCSCADAVLGVLLRTCCGVFLAAARGDYNELEQLVAGQLAGLARDASWLKSYLVSSMLLGKEAMQVWLAAAVAAYLLFVCVFVVSVCRMSRMVGDGW